MRANYLKFFCKKNRAINLPRLFILCIFMLSSCSAFPTPPPEPTSIPEPTKVYGKIIINVFDSKDPNYRIPDFVVRVAETNEIGENDNGVIKLINCGNDQHLTIWARGYYISTINCTTGTTEYNVPLNAITFSNNTNLAWISAGISNEPQLNCISCHNSQNGGKSNEYSEWQLDGHSRVFQDPYFSTIYIGDDIYRNPGQETKWVLGDQGHQVRVLQNPSIPFWGTGFKLDYPNDNGNCVYCHAPAAAIGSQIRNDLSPTINEARYGQHNVFTEGVTCDICHKVVSVQLDNNGYPYANKPGVLSYEFIHNDRNLFMGPLTNAMDESNLAQNFSCAAVFSESSFCAPCHTGDFFDTTIYNSYGEWKESNYGDKTKDTYRTCQSCHMLPAGVTDVSAQPPKNRSACSTGNISNFDFNHNMMQRGNDNLPALIKQAGNLITNYEIKDGKIELTVLAANSNAGHKFPTDSPMRHLILIVDAQTSSGTTLPLIKGDRIPAWGGVGASNLDHAGKPGQIYANILMSRDTYFSPAVDYWNAVNQAWPTSDTRIKPNESVESKYIFSLPPNGKARLHIKLIYRYAFIDLARQKGWPVNDIIVAETVINIP